MAKRDKQPYRQASFRLTPDTHQTICEIARQTGISQSEVMRAATNLLKRTVQAPDNLKLATVDVNDSIDSTHYKVVEWIING